MEETAVSDCPTPTVSTIIVLNPAASQSMIVSRVFLATPPSVPAAGEGLIKALGSMLNLSILVLSPRILPRVCSLLGSIASTARVLPLVVRSFPKVSMKVLFPAPGTPVIPILIDLAL